jgi:hypothetical protein
MQSSNVPAKFPIPFANSAGALYTRTIPQASQIGIQDGAASLTDGFPPKCFVPVASGGTPPFGKDFNGLLKQVTQWDQWQQAGGPIVFDASFQSSIGGYPMGAIVEIVAGGPAFMSTVENNTVAPAVGAAGWMPIPTFGANVTTVTATSTLSVYNAGLILVNATSGNVIITMPSVAGANGVPLPFNFVRVDASANTVTVNAAGSDAFWPTGGASIQIAVNGSLPLSGDGVSSWRQTSPGMTQASGIVGSVRNAKMNVASASATASWTADEVVLESALAGLRYCVANANASINLGTTGAGGMDTGTAPLSGFVAIYGIYNPSTTTLSLLAANATSAAAPSVYAGGHMPSGYTASALLAVWPTNTSRQFVIGSLRDRRLTIDSVNVLTTNSASGTYIGFPLSSAAPLNAISVGGWMSINNTTNSAMSLNIAADVSGMGQQAVSGFVNSNNALSNNFSMDLLTPQNLYFNAVSQSGTPAINVYISSYTI